MAGIAEETATGQIMTDERDKYDGMAARIEAEIADSLDEELEMELDDDRLQEPYRQALIPDYDAIRATCLDGGAGTLWISGSGSTLMAVTDDTIVAKFLQVKLREQFPKCDTHILTCDTEGAQIEYL